ncbi:MAG: hydroxypyruvate isomerase [Acidobacteria bacterium]|nr:hydroxypyruvate isomerase [Acidobacteriota bacterium]
MPRYSANLTLLWPELGDPYARFRAAAEAGFTRVERLFVHDLDPGRVQAVLGELSLSLVLFDPHPGNWAAGERGLLALRGREGELRESVLAALDTAGRLGNRLLNVLAGVVPEEQQAAAREVAVENLRALAPAAQAAGVTLLVEPINVIDMPGYAFSSVPEAAEVVRAVRHPAVRLQFDAYHAARSGGDMAQLLRREFDLVRHVQIADLPGRHQPGTGALPIDEFLALLDELGYQGAVGLEYVPLGTTDEALAWLPRDRRG